MESRQIWIGLSILTGLVLSFLGGINLHSENIYYCENRGLVMQCDNLGRYYGLDNGKCINSEVGNKLCLSGWIKIVNDLNVIQKEIDGKQQNEKWLCNHDGCKPILKNAN